MAKILVADDELDLREAITLALEAGGHSVTETASGLQAITLAVRGRFDLVMLDVDLEELQAPAVARVLQDLGPVPIVAMSGRRDDWQSEMLASGATACLPKPFGMDEMLSLVRSIVRTRSRRERGWPTDVRGLSIEEIEALQRLSARELDALPFGVIALDGEGRIVEYNAYESEASTHRAPDVIGMRFSELAPCTTVKKLARRLESAMRGDAIDSVVRFVFPHGRGRALVSVRVHRDPGHGRAWIFVSKRTGPGLQRADRAALEALHRVPR